MRMPKTASLAGYALIAAADAYLASRTSTRSRLLRFLTKPLLMPALLMTRPIEQSGRTDPGRRPRGANVLLTATAAAEAFSWGGDVALLGRSEKSFLTGVGSFAGAHLCYIAGFAAVRDREAPVSLLRRKGVRTAGAIWTAAGPAMAFAATRKDRSLGLPVLFYSGLLSAMFAASTQLDPALPAAARHRIALGASLFLLSDTILAVQKFLLARPDPRIEASVMGTYTTGQWLIADGVARAG